MFYSVSDTVGQVVLTASGVVGDSGKPQLLFGYGFKSGGTAGNVTFFDGVSSVLPSAVMWDHTGTINVTVFNPLSAGIMFKTGLYASFDGNVTRGTFWVRQFLT